MSKLEKLIETLNGIKFEYELSINLTPEEIHTLNIKDDYDKLMSIKCSLDKVKLALDDVNILTLIKLFVDFSDQEKLSLEENILNMKYKCEAMVLEIHFLTLRLKHNQDQISKLELENIQLKTDLRVNKINKPWQNNIEEKCNFISPSYIHSSFKFDINHAKETKYPETNEIIFLSPKLKTLYDLVMKYSIRGQYNVAIPLCEKALLDIEKVSSKYCNDYASILHIMANVYKDLGDYQKSVCLMLEVLVIRENIPETSKIKIVNTLNCISILYGLMYYWSEAATYCKRSITIMREIYVGHEINIAKQLETMALIYKNDNQNQKAIECLEEALSIYRMNKVVNLSSIARVQSIIASCYLSQFQFEISLNIYKDILTTCYQSHLFEIWEIDKPLWKIAEEKEYTLGSNFNNIKSNYINTRLLETLDESELLDVLHNMAFIYRQLNMNKAAKFLEMWPKCNIPVPTIQKKIFKSHSLIHLNDDSDITNEYRRRSRRNSFINLGLRKNIEAQSQNNNARRLSLSMSRKTRDIEVTIFESWSKFLVKKRSD